jgi:CzcA family heavy metal efflux pump
MNLFPYVHRHAKAFLFTAAVLLISGIAATLNLPLSLFPDVTFPRIVVLADNGEQPVERMMVEVTKPLEEAASSIPGVQTVRSITGRGSTEISIGLDWGTNVLQTLQLLQGRIANIRNALPANASIQAEQMTVSVFPIQGYSLTSERHSQVELRDIALYQIRPALMRVKGVARVEITGGDSREFLVQIRPADLSARRLSIRQVAEAIEKTNLVASSGILDNNYQMYLSLVSSLFVTTDNIGDVVVSVQNGVAVRVRDLADVSPSAADKFIRTTAHGQDAVLINVMKHPTGSTVQIGQDIADRLATLHLPADMRVENCYDQGDFIRSSILSTRDSIVFGIVLAMLVLLVFLRSWRISLVILFVVPTTIALTFLCLFAVGLTINIMTLGGIAAAVGLIIDDAIVIIENIFSQYARRHGTGNGGTGFRPLMFIDTASASLNELMPAIIGSTASTIVIHIPLAFLGGVTGAFFASLSVTMVFAMLISFILSITLAPLLSSFILREQDLRKEVSLETGQSALALWYERLLRRMLDHRWIAIPAALMIMLLTYGVYTRLGSDFMPEMDEGAFVLDYTSPPGTSLNETHRMLTGVEHILLTVPEVESYARRTGTQLGFFLTEPNNGDILVKLKKARARSIEEVIAEVRTRVETAEPALRIEFGQLMMDVIGDLTNNPAPVEIKLFGEATQVLHDKAAEVKRAIESVPGVVDAFDGVVISGPSFIVHVDPLKASLAGLSTAEVRDQIETIMRGTAETAMQKGEKMIPVRTRFPGAYRTDIDRIARLQVTNGEGILVPLSGIAVIEKTAGQAEIHREGLRQMVAVTARISGRDLGSTINEIKSRLASTVRLPEGVLLEYGGVYQTQQESFRGLLLVILAAFLLVFIVLLFEFGEFAVPLSIFIVNILSLAGVAVALWLTGVTLNISSLVGVIMIIGIVAENAIFVMHEFRLFQSSGLAMDEALIRATRLRARPILMTTLAAVLALTPLSLGIGAGAQMQRPLAIAVIGGFSTSSLLLFFGLPTIYRLLHRSGATEA